MDNEIIILCNSAACLNEISSGKWQNLHQRNIFTCNLGYTFFRTTARHLNIFSDAEPIKAFIEQPNWTSVYDTWQYTGIEFILSPWDLQTKNITIKRHESCKANTILSPVSVPGSSAINALLYLNAVQKFDTIHLLGYTINEWEGIENVKELQGKKQALDAVYSNYTVNNKRQFVFEFNRK